ncbi:MAG: hypothetical protein K8R59_00565 [Thermoanaerobaculales bacterium]|nr:hypothetical protein [Thermoanaerobaculales bacterium]
MEYFWPWVWSSVIALVATGVAIVQTVISQYHKRTLSQLEANMTMYLRDASFGQSLRKSVDE